MPTGYIVGKLFKNSQKTLNLPAGYDPLHPQCMRANVLTVPMRRAMLPPMTPLMVLYCIQQMHQCLDDVRDIVEWITTVEETVIQQVEAFAAMPDPVISDSNRENFDYKENLD